MITVYFSSQSNLPTSGAQQMVKNRNLTLKSGVIAVGNEYNLIDTKRPLGFAENRKHCLLREGFSLNLLDD